MEATFGTAGTAGTAGTVGVHWTSAVWCAAWARLTLRYLENFCGGGSDAAGSAMLCSYAAMQ